jgi:hypothetical protein
MDDDVRTHLRGQMKEIGSGTDLPAKSPEVDFALVLSRVIGSIKEDPVQLRNAIYELARIKLQREGWQTNPPIDILEMRRLMLALESAIERVETIYSRHDELKALQSLDRLIGSLEVGVGETRIQARDSRLIIDQTPAHATDADRPPNLLTTAKRAPPNLVRSWRWSGQAPLLRGALVAIFALALCIALGRQLGLFARQAPQPAAPMVQKGESLEPKSVMRAPGSPPQTPATMLQPQPPAVPLPDVYGIYAVSGGQLHELEALVGRVPDYRILMSTPISAPSHTILPDGRIVFIVYNRDVARSAPERVTVRVIAKVTRAMTFNRGQASRTNVQDSWTIRNVSYELRVAPLSGNFEMLLIRPENAEFVFPAGRYGLVYKDQSYDFTVAGPVTEAAQCLERIEAANGAFYSECRNP